MYRRNRNGFYISSLGITITKREIITSISIISIMLIVGFYISWRIQDKIDDANSVYMTAVKIDSSSDNDLFVYSMDTNVGNTFVYGKLKAVDPVTFPEIGGEYMQAEKVKEVYRRHTRQVPHTRTINGKTSTYYTTEVYYSWDYAGSEVVTCNEVTFSGVKFASKKIELPSTNYLCMITNGTTRYKYYGSDIEYVGTLYSNLKDKTISDNSDFYENKTIDETIEYLKQSGVTTITFFWVVWVLFISGVTIIFYRGDNEWLER